MDNLLGILIVVLACGYILKTLYKKIKSDGSVGCSCDCSSCNIEITRNEPRNGKSEGF